MLLKLFALLLWPFRQLHRVITGVHNGYWAVLSVGVAIAAIYFAMPKAPPRPDNGPGTENIVANQAVVTNEVVSPPPPPPPAGECDSLDASERKNALLTLLTTRAEQCVDLLSSPIELFYSCRADGSKRKITLKHQWSGLINKEVIAFSATYDGPEQMDLSKVEVKSTTPETFRKLCREKEKRRSFLNQ